MKSSLKLSGGLGKPLGKTFKKRNKVKENMVYGYFIQKTQVLMC